MLPSQNKKAFKIVNKMQNMNLQHALIVLKQNITPCAANRMSNFSKFTLEHFTVEELQYNVAHHVKVPKHYLLTSVEASVVKDKFQCPLSSLNKIQQKDPIAKYFNAKVGQVFKIRRYSPEGHSFTAYRIVTRSSSKS